MWYLTNDGKTVSQTQSSDSIELTDNQAQQAIEAKRNGKLVLVKDNVMLIREPYSTDEEKYVNYKAGIYTLTDLEYADDTTQTIVTDTYQNLYAQGHISKDVYLKYLKIDVDNQIAALITEVNTFVSNPLNWADLTSEQQTEAATYRSSLKALSSDPAYPDVTLPTKPTFMVAA